MTTEPNEAGLVPAAPQSPLASLRERRKTAEKKLFLDLKVPRLEPEVFVRFKPIPQHELAAANRRNERSKDREKVVRSDATLLAGAAVGVFEIIDGDEVSIDPTDRSGEWPAFDENLGRLLGLEVVVSGAEVVRALYLTDGDIMAVTAQVGAWSGFRNEDLDREDQGN